MKIEDVSLDITSMLDRLVMLYIGEDTCPEPSLRLDPCYFLSQRLEISFIRKFIISSLVGFGAVYSLVSVAISVP